MSKSLGNFLTINELLERSPVGSLPGAVLRLAMLGTHYREPIDWTLAKVKEARSKLAMWNAAIGLHWDNLVDQFWPAAVWDSLLPPSETLLAALREDLNTPLAISRISEAYPLAELRNGSGVLELLSDLNFLGLANEKTLYFGQAVVGLEWPSNIADQIVDLGTRYRIAVANNSVEVASLIVHQVEELNCKLDDNGFLDVSIDFQGETEKGTSVQALIAARLEARKAKNWAESDRIRDELAAMGIAIKDNKDGTTSWEVKR